MVKGKGLSSASVGTRRQIWPVTRDVKSIGIYYVAARSASAGNHDTIVRISFSLK